MAIFASTTTSGYSDPLKALSIKALEQRMKDQQAQAAAQQNDAAMMATIPGGIGHVLGVVGDQMKQGRTDQALVAQRAELANVMSGIGPEGPNPQQLARVHAIDPALGEKFAQQIFEARKAAQDREFQGTEHRLTRDQAKELAGQQDRRAREMQQEQLSATETTASRSDERARTLQTERLAAEERMAEAKAKATAEANAADPKTIKARKDLEKEATQEKALVAELGTAQEALAKGINTGRTSSLKTIAAQLPGGDMFFDREQANRTVQFDATMDKVATTAMSTLLKGASTDKEMEAFKQQWNNPNTTIEQKREAFGRVLQAAKEDAAIGSAAVAKTGGSLTGPGGPAAAVAPPTPTTAQAPAAAVPAAAGGGVVSGITEAEAMALPAGTRFKLKDGRTGVAE